MIIKTKYNSDYEYTSVTENGQSVNIDMRPENKVHMSPMELLLSALTACMAVEVALMLKKKRRTVNDLQIEAHGTRRNENPKSFTDIHLIFILRSPDATLEELSKVTQLGLDGYCSVGSSLKAEITFECKIA